MNLFYEDTPVCVAETYKYLGTIVDPTLTLNAHLDKQYKSASTKLRLLERLQYYLTEEASNRIVTSIIQPGLTFNSLSNLSFTKTRKERFESFDNRANVVLRNTQINTLDMIYKHALQTVRKCLNGDTCHNFHGYFEKNLHEMETRNCGTLLKIPKVKLEFAKKAFYFQGVKLFNSLPIETRNIQTLKDFKEKLNEVTFMV